MKLDQVVAVVTGGTRGVGRGVAAELARDGARVFITGRSVPDHAPFEEPVTAIRCDHRDDRQVEAAFDGIVRDAGTIDVLVNNVWGGYERMIDDGAFTWERGPAPHGEWSTRVARPCGRSATAARWTTLSTSGTSRTKGSCLLRTGIARWIASSLLRT